MLSNEITTCWWDYSISGLTLEENLIFVGFMGMIDPPRSEVKNSISISKNAGIRTVMITGDHVITAAAIAKQLGILTGDKIAITGTELEAMSELLEDGSILDIVGIELDIQ